MKRSSDDRKKWLATVCCMKLVGLLSAVVTVTWSLLVRLCDKTLVLLIQLILLLFDVCVEGSNVR